MTFRSNFLIEAVTSIAWMSMNLSFYLLIFRYTPELGAATGWGRSEFFAFIATSMMINSLVQTFFMANADEFSELIRTGGLDFALLKPIDTQFLISLQRMNWSSLANFVFAVVLMTYALTDLTTRPESPLALQPFVLLAFPLYVFLGVTILYSLTISLAATSIWLGRNQSLYDFWVYITNFSRYPMEIYQGPVGKPLRLFFTFIVPILVVVTVPARMVAMPLSRQNWPLAVFGLVAAFASLLGSRWIFNRALGSYRSASS